MKRKYESWGFFLKKRREQRYRSAREFCSRVSVGISYPQYSRYEAGDQLPNLEQALQLCKFLDIPMLEGLLHWCRAQMAETAALMEVEALIDKITAKATAVAQGVPPAEAQTHKGAVSLDDVIVFNRAHLKLFGSSPVYRDIFTYVNSFAPEWISAKEIALALEIRLEDLEEMLEQLNDLGVLLVAGGKCRSAKRNFYFPDDADFFDLRNANLTHNANAILRRLKHEDVLAKRGYRGLITRELTADQLEKVILRSEELLEDIISMPESANPEKIYSLCLMFGERFSRPQVEPPRLPPSRREPEASL